MAGQGIQSQPEAVEKLQMIAGHDGLDRLLFRIEIGMGNDLGKQAG